MRLKPVLENNFNRTGFSASAPTARLSWASGLKEREERQRTDRRQKKSLSCRSSWPLFDKLIGRQVAAMIRVKQKSNTKETEMQKITPFLWFDNQAEEAMNFYTSIFKNSKAGNVTRYGEAGPGPKDSVLTASFELEGLEFTALNGGPHYKFTEAISLYVNCESQEEVDYFWNKLSEGGQIQQCGWLKDKFGVSWQIIPSALPRLLNDSDREKANRVMQAMLQMKKIEIARLKQAYEG